MSTTTRWAIPYPELTNAADVPQWMHDMAVSLDDHAKDDQGVLSARPISTPAAPGKRGRYYMVIGDGTPANNGILWRDNGTGWDQVGIAVVGNAQLANDAVDARVIAADAVGSSEIAADAVGTSELAPNSVTAVELHDSVIPSRGATGGTEALRAIGSGTGQVLAGNDVRIPVAVTSLPGLPANTQEVYLMDSLTSPTWYWHLMYLTAFSKWIFLGGIEFRIDATANFTTVTGTTWQTHTNMASLTVPVTGLYKTKVYSQNSQSGGSSGTVTRRFGISVAGATPVDQIVPIIANTDNNFAWREKPTSFTAGDVLTFQAQGVASPITVQHSNVFISLQPIRLG